MPTAHELVARGAELLDEKLPGWADVIDLDRLEMSDACNCVLGQIGTEVFNLDRSWHRDTATTEQSPFGQVEQRFGIDSEEYGFEMAVASFDLPPGGRLKWIEYGDLQDAWKGEIVARRTLGDERG